MQPLGRLGGRKAATELEDGDERVPVELEGEVLHVRGDDDGDERFLIVLEGAVFQSLVVVNEDERGGAGGAVDERTIPLGRPRTVLHELARRPVWLW